MASMSVRRLDQIFAALADPTRRAILARLASGRATVGELATPFPISLPAISRHIKVLERAALIVRIPEGQHRWCEINPPALTEAASWLSFHQRFWNESLDALAAHLRRARTRRSRKPKGGMDGEAR